MTVRIELAKEALSHLSTRCMVLTPTTSSRGAGVIAETSGDDPVGAGLNLFVFGLLSLVYVLHRERREAWARKKWVKVWGRVVSFGAMAIGAIAVVVGLIMH